MSLFGDLQVDARGSCLRLWRSIDLDETWILYRWFMDRSSLTGQYPWYSISLIHDFLNSHEYIVKILSVNSRTRVLSLMNGLVRKGFLVKGKVGDLNPLHHDTFSSRDRSFYTISDRMRDEMKKQGLIKRAVKVAP